MDKIKKTVNLNIDKIAVKIFMGAQNHEPGAAGLDQHRQQLYAGAGGLRKVPLQHSGCGRPALVKTIKIVEIA